MRSLRTIGWLAVLLLEVGCDRAPSQDELGWRSLALGSAVETRTVTHVESFNVRDAVSTTQHRLVTRTADHAELVVETRRPDGSVDNARLTVSLNPQPVDTTSHPGMTVQTRSETCNVPAGTFNCNKTEIEFRQGDVVRRVTTWTAAPVHVRHAPSDSLEHPRPGMCQATP